jgi:membrane protein required for colicin V production
MVWLDIVLIIVLTILALHGLLIGIIRSVFDIIGILIGYVLAVSFSGSVGIPRFLAFLLIFVFIVVAVHILGRIISKAIRTTPLGTIDRVLGGLLGLFKGIVVCFVFLLVLLLLQKSNKAIYKSAIAPEILKGGLIASQVLPDKWYNWIEDVVTKRELVQGYEDYHISL